MTLSAQLVPDLSFVVTGKATACNSQSATAFQTGSTATNVPLGILQTTASNGAAQNLSVSTNAGGGFVVTIRTSGTTPGALRSGALYVDDVAGTNASPGAAPASGTVGFGYTSSDASTSFTSNTFAKLTNTPSNVMVATAGTVSKTSCVGFQAAIGSGSLAGHYAATVIYTAVPTF